MAVAVAGLPWRQGGRGRVAVAGWPGGSGRVAVGGFAGSWAV